jgi:hypothetical protein
LVRVGSGWFGLVRESLRVGSGWFGLVRVGSEIVAGWSGPMQCGRHVVWTGSSLSSGADHVGEGEGDGHVEIACGSPGTMAQEATAGHIARDPMAHVSADGPAVVDCRPHRPGPGFGTPLPARRTFRPSTQPGHRLSLAICYPSPAAIRGPQRLRRLLSRNPSRHGPPARHSRPHHGM